jgi:hypothetical protein
VKLEQAGRPAVVFTTTRFEALTRQVASSFGLPDSRIVVVDHPLGGTDAQTIQRWADGSVDTVMALVTGRG